MIQRKIFLEVQNELGARGATVIDEKSAFVHVSGHPNKGDLERMYQWVRPQIVVPVHGEHRHMAAHAALALACQVPHAPTVENGDVLRLAPGDPAVVDKVAAGRLIADGRTLIPFEGSVARSRRQMMWNGSLAATLVLTKRGRIAARPVLTATGLLGESGADRQLAEDAIEWGNRSSDSNMMPWANLQCEPPKEFLSPPPLPPSLLT